MHSHHATAHALAGFGFCGHILHCLETGISLRLRDYTFTDERLEVCFELLRAQVLHTSLYLRLINLLFLYQVLHVLALCPSRLYVIHADAENLRLLIKHRLLACCDLVGSLRTEHPKPAKTSQSVR